MEEPVFLQNQSYYFSFIRIQKEKHIKKHNANKLIIYTRIEILYLRQYIIQYIEMTLRLKNKLFELNFKIRYILRNIQFGELKTDLPITTSD